MPRLFAENYTVSSPHDGDDVPRRLSHIPPHVYEGAHIPTSSSTPNMTAVPRPTASPPRGILRQPVSPRQAERQSVPDISPKTRLPTSHVHGARGRFVSLPVAVPEIDTERDRLARACGEVPCIGSPCTPPQHQEGSFAQDTSNIPQASKWLYTDLLLRLKNLLRLDGRNVKDYIDLEDIEALYLADVQERERREATRAHIARMRAGLEPSEFAQDTHVFAAPLNETVLIASRTAILNGARHDLPIVLFACTEELYRTGIYKSGLFRDLPNRPRHMELIRTFNSPPSFGENVSLRDEDTAVVGSVLSTYLKNMPEPLIGDPIFEPLWNWCIRPSVHREEIRLKREESEDEEARETFYRTGRKVRRPTRRETIERRRMYAAEDEALDSRQVPVIQCLLRLLPTHRLSMLVYVCTFFSQVPLCPENGMTLDDLARMFAQPMLGGPRPAAKHMMVWFLKNWSKISEGLLDSGLGPDIPELHPRRQEEEDEEDEEVEVGSPVVVRSPYNHTRRNSRDSRSRMRSTGSSSGSGDWDVDTVKKGKAERGVVPRSVIMADPVPPPRPRRSSLCKGRLPASPGAGAFPASVAGRESSESVLLPPQVFKTMPALSPIDSAGQYSASVDPLTRHGPEADLDEQKLRVQLQLVREERDEAWLALHSLRDILGQTRG